MPPIEIKPWPPQQRGVSFDEILYYAFILLLAFAGIWLLCELIAFAQSLLHPDPPRVAPEEARRDVEELQQIANRLRARRRVVAPQPDDQCAICLDRLSEEPQAAAAAAAPNNDNNFRLVLEAIPCGHELHADCGQQLIQSAGFRRGGSLCWECRTGVALFVPSFVRHPRVSAEQVTAALPAGVRHFNRATEMLDARGIAAGMNFFFHHFSRLPRMLKLRLAIVLVIAVLYVVSPFDLISEAEFGVVGFLDDIFVFLICSAIIFILLRAAFV